MIEGIGVDLVEVGRIRDTIEAWGERFLEKIFTGAEIRYCSSKKSSYQHFAARFAAKEAVAKALAIGWSGGFRWKDVEVVNDQAGKPSIVLYGHVKNLMSRSKIFLSISHTHEIVVAFAVIGRAED